LYNGLTGRENLRFFADMYGSDSRCESLFTEIGIAKAAEMKVARYSRGMKKRLALATALVGNPEVLLLDEPFNGLDPEGQADLRRILTDLGRDLCILVSSHDLGAVEAICDEVIVLRQRLLFCGSIDDLAESARGSVLDGYLRLVRSIEETL
jgi:ABC-2 type transport system ATP-binding protein